MSEVDAAASTTVSTLVGIYGIPLEKAVAAVAAIDDRSDVEKAVAWVIANAGDEQQADDEDRGGAVEFIHCPHLDDESRPLIAPAALTLTAPCASGCDTRENWVCLQCGATHCSRYVNQHALAHQEAAGHPTGLSLGDLNVWTSRAMHTSSTRASSRSWRARRLSSLVGAAPRLANRATPSRPAPRRPRVAPMA